LANFDQIRGSILRINNPDLKTALLTLLEEARADLTEGVSAVKKVSDRIEKWYDQTMDRVSGWYKRRTQWFLFGIALLFALALNVDTVKICQALSKSSTLRDSVTEQAKHLSLPPAPAGANIDNQFSQVQEAVKRLDGLGVPLGWTDESKLWTTFPQSGNDYLVRSEKLMGLLLTAFAASLGAPFWFDVLNKFMVVRSAGKSPKEQSAAQK
jgi:hypothetical protein